MNEQNTQVASQSTNLLTTITESPNLAMELMFNEALFLRCHNIAKSMSEAKGITPIHLIGKTEACYAVVTRSILWQLDPFSVAACTYEVRGKVGYEGKLCRAILEKSGRFEERLRYEKIGDWSRIQGKTKIMQSKDKDKGSYANKGWDERDEEGLGVRICYQLKGQEPDCFEFYMSQAHPRNSTLWATDPWTQIQYTATRRFANSEIPDIFMGVPFDLTSNDAEMVDVTPTEPKKRTSSPSTRRKSSRAEGNMTEGPEGDKAPASESFAGSGPTPKFAKKTEPSKPEEEPVVSPSVRFFNEFTDKLKSAGGDCNKVRQLYEAHEQDILFLPDGLREDINMQMDDIIGDETA